MDAPAREPSAAIARVSVCRADCLFHAANTVVGNGELMHGGERVVALRPQLLRQEQVSPISINETASLVPCLPQSIFSPIDSLTIACRWCCLAGTSVAFLQSASLAQLRSLRHDVLYGHRPMARYASAVSETRSVASRSSCHSSYGFLEQFHRRVVVAHGELYPSQSTSIRDPLRSAAEFYVTPPLRLIA